MEPVAEPQRTPGMLVEEAALERAEEECLADGEARARRWERETERWMELDQEYIQSFAKRVLELFPNCPAGREQAIAEHACQKYSGREGRSASLKNLDEKAVLLAVSAPIWHAETHFDKRLAEEVERHLARDRVKAEINEVLERWMALTESCIS
ncbi:MAG: DUF2293 domain-containing protein [Anaerolineaceae bacterium]|nr:DUF2293 domain-containing protein [Anaerolineaceae bacterium]